ncbi:MAG: ABC transporter permease [Chloroflexota bacterium]
MSGYVAGRLAQVVPLLLLVSVASFALLRLAPGDPAALVYGGEVPAEELAAIRQAWGLDLPLPAQYGRWLSRAAVGDFGRSYADGRPALQVVLDRVPATLLLTVSALVLAVLVGISLGAWAGWRPGSLVDHSLLAGATVVAAVPGFWLGLVAILVFSVALGWLPSAGIVSARGEVGLADRLAHLAMPCAVLALREAAALFRYTRSAVREAAGSDYARTARAKGLREVAVLRAHVLRNALLPAITVVGLFIPRLLSGSVVVETLFAWPGMGRLAIESAFRRDYSVLMAEIMAVGCLVAVTGLLVDLAYAAADPRIRYRRP